MSCELGLLERADGSARLVQGNTSVLCGVYGPAEVKNNKELYDRAVVDVLVKPASGNSGTKERHLESIICSICETCILTSLHPHTALSITLQIEHSAGALLSVLVNACCLALMDACVPLSSTFAALTCGRTEAGELLVDPDPTQESKCWSVCMCVMEGNSGDVIASHSQGAFSLYQLLSVLVNACCLALMDACVPLSSTFAALTCGRTEAGELLVDPDPTQESKCHSVCTCVMEGNSGDVIASHSQGAFSLYQLQEAIRTVRECSKNISSFYREAISKKLSKDAKFSLLSEQKPHP